MKIANLKVGTRLTTGFGLVLLMMVILISIGFARLTNIGDLNNKMIEKDWVKADAANTINSTTRDNARRTLELFIVADQTQAAGIYEQIRGNKKTIDEAFETLDKLIYLPEGKTLLAKIKENRGKYAASFQSVGELLKQGKKDEAISMMNAETLPALDALQAPIEALTELQKKIVTVSSAQVHEDIYSARALMVIFGGIATLIGIAAAFLITRGLLKQLGGEPDYATGIAGRIAEGDLTVEINTKENYHSSLLFAIKAMRDSLSNIVGQVRAGTDTIATATSQIASGNLDLSSRTEEQASALEETASSMEELTSTVRQNSDNARQASQLAISASEVAVKGGAVVSQVVDTMGSINDSSKKIVDIIGVIDGIAFQTNDSGLECGG